jgi:hypothetical protein
VGSLSVVWLGPLAPGVILSGDLSRHLPWRFVLAVQVPVLPAVMEEQDFPLAKH